MTLYNFYIPESLTLVKTGVAFPRGHRLSGGAADLVKTHAGKYAMLSAGILVGIDQHKVVSMMIDAWCKAGHVEGDTENKALGWVYSSDVDNSASMTYGSLVLRHELVTEMGTFAVYFGFSDAEDAAADGDWGDLNHDLQHVIKVEALDDDGDVICTFEM